MSSHPLFKGLTRPVTLAGLPANYFMILVMTSMLGFLVFSSWPMTFVSLVVGYPAVRIAASYDPRLLDVFFITVQKTPIRFSILTGRGLTYYA